jgi:competence protein ComEC
LILNTGIAVLIVSVFSGYLASGLSKVLFLMLRGLNSAVEFINGLPWATVTGLVLSIAEVALLYFMMIMLSRAMLHKNSVQLIISLALLVAVSGSVLFRKYRILQQQKIIVYQLNGHSGIDFIHGNHAVFLADSGLYNDDQTMGFNILSNRVFSGVKQIGVFGFEGLSSAMSSTAIEPLEFYKPCFYRFGGIKMAVIGNDFEMHQPERPVAVDALILRGDPGVSIDELRNQFDFEHLIIDGSNSYWAVRDWKSQCDSSGISCHDVKTEGYFQIESQ